MIIKHQWYFRVFLIVCIMYVTTIIYSDHQSILTIRQYCDPKNKFIEKQQQSQFQDDSSIKYQCFIEQLFPIFKNTDKISRGLQNEMNSLNEQKCVKYRDYIIQQKYNVSDKPINILIWYLNINQIFQMLQQMNCLRNINKIIFQPLSLQSQTKNAQLQMAKIIGLLKWKGFNNITQLNTILLQPLINSQQKQFNYQQINVILSPIVSKYRASILQTLPQILSNSEYYHTAILQFKQSVEDASMLLSQIQADLSYFMQDQSNYVLDVYQNQKNNVNWMKINTKINKIKQNTLQQLRIKVKGQAIKAIIQVSNKPKSISINHKNNKQTLYTSYNLNNGVIKYDNNCNILFYDYANYSSNQLQIIQAQQNLLKDYIQKFRKKLETDKLLVKAYLSSTKGNRPSLAANILVFLARQLFNNDLSLKQYKLNPITLLIDNSQLLGNQKINRNWHIFQNFHRQIILNDIDAAFEATLIGLSNKPNIQFQITIPSSISSVLPLKFANILLISAEDTESQLRRIMEGLENRRMAKIADFRVFIPISNQMQIIIARNLIKAFLETGFKCQMLQYGNKQSFFMESQTDFEYGFLVVHASRFYKQQQQSSTIINTIKQKADGQKHLQKPKPVIQNILLKYINNLGFTHSSQKYVSEWFHPLNQVQIQTNQTQSQNFDIFQFIIKQLGNIRERQSENCYVIVKMGLQLNRSIVFDRSYLQKLPSSQKLSVMIIQLRQIYNRIMMGENIIVDIDDELLLLMIANKIGKDGKIILGKNLENKTKLIKFAVINDIKGIIDEGLNQKTEEILKVITNPQKMNNYANNEQVYIKYRNKQENKQLNECIDIIQKQGSYCLIKKH